MIVSSFGRYLSQTAHDHEAGPARDASGVSDMRSKKPATGESGAER